MVDEIAPEELKERLDRDEDVQIVDIRPPRAFEQGHIPGAENIPFNRFVEEVEEYDWGDNIVMVCPMGESSLQAARLLESYEGIDDEATVANLDGGYQEWEYDLSSTADIGTTDRH